MPRYIMCTWAGYTGDKAAAPILLEMARKQEGFWSGYYSGLATQDDSGFHHNKVTGSFDDLVEQTGPADFSGTIGLIHSRTNSGGDREWGHPFVGGDSEVMLVAQGHGGVFSDETHRVKLGNELLDAGFVFRSATPGKVGKYPLLKNGCCVHGSEIAAHALAYFFRKSGDSKQAAHALFDRPFSEAVYTAIFRDVPGVIFVANVNQPLTLARYDGGFYKVLFGRGLFPLRKKELPA